MVQSQVRGQKVNCLFLFTLQHRCYIKTEACFNIDNKEKTYSINRHQIKIKLSCPHMHVRTMILSTKLWDRRPVCRYHTCSCPLQSWSIHSSPSSTPKSSSQASSPTHPGFRIRPPAHHDSAVWYCWPFICTHKKNITLSQYFPKKTFFQGILTKDAHNYE